MDIADDGVSVAAVTADALARVGTALADRNRRRLLQEVPAYPSDLAASLGMTRGNVSDHLACLRGCGLVHGIPVGRRVRYEPADPKLAHALADLSALVLPIDPPGWQRPCTPDGYA